MAIFHGERFIFFKKINVDRGFLKKRMKNELRTFEFKGDG